jgi:DNA (cytosine-5)-methyltransferase 1
MKHGSLFSGIGGFDLASEWMNWENVFHCEIEKFPRKILKYYWSNAKSYEDITKTDFSIHKGEIDILTGGFPCQPYSVAGKRRGKEDTRHLWPEMLRAIREIKPKWVVGENVRGIVNWNEGLVFEEVQSDLEAEGYEVQPFILPACGVNAPHRRERIWFIAYSNGERCDCGGGNRKERQVQDNFNRHASKDKPERKRGECRSCETGKVRNATYSCCSVKQRKHKCEQEKRKSYRQNSGIVPTCFNDFPTQTPICDGDDGLSDRLDAITFPKWRTESIKGGGNAIVPQVAMMIFKAIEKFNNVKQGNS